MLFAPIGPEGQVRLRSGSAVLVGCGAIGAAAAKYGYVWSDDQSREITRGWIMKADTIGPLARVIQSLPTCKGRFCLMKPTRERRCPKQSRRSENCE
jgi:hypothetical protein